jgi:hypothetical protein
MQESDPGPTRRTAWLMATPLVSGLLSMCSQLCNETGAQSKRVEDHRHNREGKDEAVWVHDPLSVRDVERPRTGIPWSTRRGLILERIVP